ncbi:S8 family serine peptidase, partial [Candidatus Margulisiibacteriota bacterium]
IVGTASIRALNVKHSIVRVEQLYKKALVNRPDWTQLQDDYVLYFPDENNVERVVSDYLADPNVVSASPDTVVHAFATPDDPKYSSQYGLTNISAPQAWDRTTGSSSVVIAVLDTGINADHEDFAGRIDPRGEDFVNDDLDPTDDFGHGTSVSGVIGATTNNSIGVAGVDWQAKILPLKVLNSIGEGDMSDILAGLAYANSLSVEVVNMSFGQYNPYSSLATRCQEAYDNGVVLVAAAGNGNTSNPSYPAYYSTVMSVAAVDNNDIRSYWGGIDSQTGLPQASNYGDWVDVCAPGTLIWSTHMNGGYSGSNNGTSLAAPFVAGLAGLLISVNPSLSNQDVIDKIKSLADDVDSEQEAAYQGKLGSGRINAYRTISGLLTEVTSPGSGDYLAGQVDIYGTAAGWDFSRYVLEAYKEGTRVATIEDSAVAIENGKLGSWQSLGNNGGHTLRLRSFSTGLLSDEIEVTVFIDNSTPEADITSPAGGAAAAGEVAIAGTATDQNYFDRYVLEYGPGTSPSTYEKIINRPGREDYYLAVDSGALGVWETAGLTGIYTIRLTTYDKVGTFQIKTIQVDLQNTSPPTKAANAQDSLTTSFALPNPFDRSTASQITFNYSLQGNFNTKIYLFDLSGNLIWQDSYLAGVNGGKSGNNNPSWNGRDLYGSSVSNGAYVYQVVADRKVITKGKIIVLN